LNLFLTQQSADMVAIRGSANSQANKASIWLPTRFNAYIDVNIAKGFGINLNTSMSPYLKSKDKNQLVYGNYISLVPRLDYPMFGFYLPVTYNLNGTISVGASMRAGPVWFGVNDFYGMASNGGLKNANFFAGVKIPIYYAKPKDRDKDKVSNRYDFCVSKPGTWTAGGCPDRDMDSVRDEADACPDQFGPKQFAGCPDADGDNVIDDKDDCPGIAGDINTNGCPDKDQDGIPDKDDICPDEAGTLAMKGCGDKDGDGVANNVDKCPDMKGDKAHGGCPDRDGDGVFDNEDDDPDVEGPIENKGKPYGDSDDDGVPDNEDTCKLIFGKKEFHGCPTPPRPNLISEMINTYDITINFGVNQWELTAAHEKLLAVLAKKMNSEEQKYNNIIIVGHTDSLETSPGNEEALSIRRAKAATDYLFYTQGIPRSRLEPAGMGSEQPIGDNTKIAGRAKNRRLSIYIRIVSN
jgi:outer membrane protein OmpA-like peptidoglycan-associated protein